MLRIRTPAAAESFTEPFFLAGQSAPAGTYLEITSQRKIQLDREDVLPATCDGRVAVYVRKPSTWAEVQARQNAH